MPMFESGFTHYDDPPPDVIDDLDELQRADRFRFANRLVGWVDVEDGEIVDAGYGAQRRRDGRDDRAARGAGRDVRGAVDARPPRTSPSGATTGCAFVQTFGGRTALPAPRRVQPPAVRAVPRAARVDHARADDPRRRSRDYELLGASMFPRHWVYDDDGKLAAKAGLADFKQWYRQPFGKHTPWGDENSPRSSPRSRPRSNATLATKIMRGGEKPKIRKLKAGALLTEQGQPGNEVFLLLDGVLVIEVDGEPLAELGPGAILGERAVLEGGMRTSTLRAVTKCRVAAATADQLDLDALARGRGRSPTRRDRARREAALRGRARVDARARPEFVRVGGHTSCVASCPTTTAHAALILDAGTGLLNLRGPLRRRAVRGHDPAHAPALGPRAGTSVLPGRRSRRSRASRSANAGAGRRAARVLEHAMSPPHFPIGPDGLRGNWDFVAIEAGTHSIEGFEVTALDIPHKGGRTFGYRVSDGSRSCAYIPDHGPSGPDATSESRARALDLAVGVDVLVHGAPFTTDERAIADLYGHATVDDAIDLARAAGVQHLVLTHHGPFRTDDAVDAMGEGAREAFAHKLTIAREGCTLDV